MTRAASRSRAPGVGGSARARGLPHPAAAVPAAPACNASAPAAAPAASATASAGPLKPAKLEPTVGHAARRAAAGLRGARPAAARRRARLLRRRAVRAGAVLRRPGGGAVAGRRAGAHRAGQRPGDAGALRRGDARRSPAPWRWTPTRSTRCWARRTSTRWTCRRTARTTSWARSTPSGGWSCRARRTTKRRRCSSAGSRRWSSTTWARRSDALDRADWVLARAPKDGDATLRAGGGALRALPLPEAKKAFQDLLFDPIARRTPTTTWG